MEQDNKKHESPKMWIVEHFTPYDAYHHGIRTIFCEKTTEFQHMLIADTGAYGRALFLDSSLQTTERDEMFYHEPLVHTPMILANRTRPVKSVLILGGADCGAARQALSWKSVERVSVVDIDGDVVDACRKHLSCVHKQSWKDSRCTVRIENALDYIQKEESGQFDVIVSDLTDPVRDSPILELFTVEHFSKVKSRLASGGVLSLQGGALSTIENDLFPRICRTLEDVFENVLPGQMFVPKYGSPLAMVIATDASPELPSMESIDETFESNLTDELEVLDGRGLHGLFGVPKCVRKAIKNEPLPFTKENIAQT